MPAEICSDFLKAPRMEGYSKVLYDNDGADNTTIGVGHFVHSGRLVEGELREEEYADFLARGFQHEFDHVQGVVFIDRVENTQELVTEKEYLRSQQSHA